MKTSEPDAVLQWFEGDEDRVLVLGELPVRLAITSTLIVFRSHLRSEICLVDAATTPWNNSMLPFSSITIPISDPSRWFQITALEALAEARKAISGMSEELEVLVQELAQEYKGSEPQLLGSALEVKFSKTANVWTVYLFLYYEVTAGASADGHWADLAGLLSDAPGAPRLASNVVSALRRFESRSGAGL